MTCSGDMSVCGDGGMPELTLVVAWFMSRMGGEGRAMECVPKLLSSQGRSGVQFAKGIGSQVGVISNREVRAVRVL